MSGACVADTEVTFFLKRLENISAWNQIKVHLQLNVLLDIF